MNPGPPRTGREAILSSAYFSIETSSFFEFTSEVRPDLLPGVGNIAVNSPVNLEALGSQQTLPHGTTIVAAVCTEGVVIAGDRRATMGNLISQRDIEKVYLTDEFTAAGFAGTAAFGIDALRLLAVELQHYEKLEGVPLTFDGKANKLATMVRANLGAAMQGLSYVPLFVGFDTEAPGGGVGRIVTYDIAGSRAEETLGYAAIGSGSTFAKSSLKKRHNLADDTSTTVRSVLEALYDAADDDSATGGPDTIREIYPLVATVTSEGSMMVPAEEVAAVAENVVAGRRERPGG